jgi:O-antigen/teichoic acid export membrane protein
LYAVSLRKLVAKALVWTTLESFTLSGLSLISLFIFARLLSPADFGVAAIALAIVQLLTVPVELLFHDALVQRKELDSLHVDSAFTFSVVLGAVLCAACWLSSGLIESVIGTPGVGDVLKWMSLSLIGMGFGCVLVAMQRRKLEFRSLALRSLLGRGGSAIAAIALAFTGGGVWALVTQQVLLVCLGTLMLWILADERPRFRFSWAPTKSLLRFGVFTTIYQLLAVAIQRVFMVLVGAYLGSVSTGLLSVAFRGVDMLRDLMCTAVYQIAMPLFSRLSDERESLFDAYNRSVQLTTLVTFPVFVGLAVCADDVVSVAFGKDWLAAAPYFAFVSLLVLPFFLRMYSVTLLRAVGRPAAPMLELIAQTAVSAGCMVWFGRHSVPLAMGAWASRLVVSIPIDMYIQRRVGGMSYLRQLRGSGTPFVAAVVMACAVLSVKTYLLPSLPALIRLFPLGLLGATVYVATIALINRELIRQFVDFVGQSLPSRS